MWNHYKSAIFTIEFIRFIAVSFIFSIEKVPENNENPSYLFLRLSMLSSTRPLDLPRSKHRSIQICDKLNLELDFKTSTNTENSKIYRVVTFKKQNKLHVWLVTHLSHPAIEIVAISREPIDQKVFLATRFHCLDNKIEIDHLDFSKPFSLHENPTFSKSEHVISTGTIEPLFMWLSMSWPNSELGLWRSSRSKSPADKCT